MNLLAGPRFSAFRAAAIALAFALCGASAAFASEYTGTVSVSDTITDVATAEATISLTVTSGGGSEAIALSALPPLPDGLAFAGSGWSTDTCAENAPLGIGGTCELTVTLTGTAIGIYDWSGTGDDGTNSITLSTVGSIIVSTTPSGAAPVSGESQSTRVGTEFSQPLTIEVVDINGTPLPGINVVFTAPTDDATATLSDTSLKTDANGRASVTATASSTAGNYAVEAKLTDYPEHVATFYLDNIPPPAKLETTVSWSVSSAKIGSEFTATLTLRNTSGRTIPQTLTTNGIPLLPGGLLLTGPIDWSGCDYMYLPLPNMATCRIYAPVKAGAGGTYHWTGAGTPGSNTNTYLELADPDGITVYGDAVAVAVTEGDDQSAMVGTDFEPLVVTVTDADGIAVPGVQVKFQKPSSGASIGEDIVPLTTNADGKVTFSVSANQLVGGYEVTASVVGIDTPAVFSLTNLVGGAATVSLVSGDGQQAAVGAAFENPFVVRVTDSYGNPLSGELVTFTPPADGASGTFPNDPETATTDADGYATSSTFTANDTAGNYEVIASAEGATSATIPAENLGDTALPAISALSPNTGPEAGGTSVTITGSEFTGATSVTFGGVEADFELVDDTIVAVTPAGSGTVDVLITTPAGTSTAIEASRFSYDTPVDPPDTSADSAELDAVQDTFTPVVAAQSSRSIVGSMTNAIRLGISGGTQTSFSTSEMFLAYGPTPADPATPFDEILVDDSQPLPDNVSIWLDTTGQGILPLSTTPERGWQVNITGGIGMRVTPDLLIGAVAGHERFSYRSEDTGATLSGSGTSLGAYAGWDVGGRLLVSLGVVNTALDYRTDAGAASGTFQASRWLVTGDISGEYSLGDFTVQPSATLLGIWETQDAYIDTLSGVHDEQQFGSATASAGFRISHALPISEDWELAPYVGAYLDAAADATIGDGDATYGVSGRLTAGATFTSADGLRIGLDGDLGGLGTDTVTLSARGNLKSSF